MELLTGGVFGSLLGGLFRLAPEVLKWLDKGNERKHELAMFQAQSDLEKVRGPQKLAEIGAANSAAVDQGVLDAFKAAIDQQTEMVKAAGGWAAALSATVRPVLTYYLLLIYSVVKLCLVGSAWASGTPLAQAIPLVYGADDMSMMSGVISYWMLDRSLMKRGL